METIKTQKTPTKSIHRIVLLALFSALAAVLMLLKFPIPLAPSFYKLDFSEAAVLIGSYILGPVAGVIIEFVKCAINLLLDGTTTAGIGELSNFIIGCSLVVPASLVMRKNRNLKGLIIGSVIGLVSQTIISAVLNYFVLIPAYVAIAGYPMDAILGMAKKIYPSITNLFDMIVLCTVPFNVIKGASAAILAALTYKAIPSSIVSKYAKTV